MENAMSNAVAGLLSTVAAELERARAKYAPFNSAHEGWAIILEEVDELWDEVRKRQGERDLALMQREAVQIAAMALRFALDVKM
jgi:hypothetical protein